MRVSLFALSLALCGCATAWDAAHIASRGTCQSQYEQCRRQGGNGATSCGQQKAFCESSARYDDERASKKQRGYEAFKRDREDAAE